MSKAIATFAISSFSADDIGASVIQAAKNAHVNGKPDPAHIRIEVKVLDEMAGEYTLLSEKGAAYASVVQLIKHALKNNPGMSKNKAIEFASMVNPKMDAGMIGEAYEEAKAKASKGKAVKEEVEEEEKESKPKARLVKKTK